MRKDPAGAASAKRKAGKLMTLKEWQLTVFSHSPSSLWRHFFPKFLAKNGVTSKRLSPEVWACIWELATEAHRAMMDKLVAEARPTIRWRGMEYLL